jgi:hypothetical protein
MYKRGIRIKSWGTEYKLTTMKKDDCGGQSRAKEV